MLNLSSKNTAYKFEQLRDEIIRNIENGYFKINEPLPSISQLCVDFGLSRVTVDRAYKHLKSDGYVSFVVGKGYYVRGKGGKIKVLLLFNKLSHYKKEIYYSMLDVLGANVRVDLQIFHYDINLLNQLIEENHFNYDYIILMPHFHYDLEHQKFIETLKKIPKDKFLILDKAPGNFKDYLGGVYQDFENDIYNTLISVTNLLKKYKTINLIFPEENIHPLEIIDGAKKFCAENDMILSVVENYQAVPLESGMVFIVIEDAELSGIIKRIRSSEFELGKDIGVISFNDSILKDLLKITVFTTEFSEMGRKIAEMIIKKDFKKINNNFTAIIRESL